MWEKLQGIDYETQKKLLEEIHKDTDESSKVGISKTVQDKSIS